MTVNVIPLCLSIDYFRSESLRSFTVSKQDFSLCLPLICRWQISAFGHSAVFSLLHTCLSNCKQFEESFVLASHRGSPSCRASPLQKQSTGLFLNSPLSSADGILGASLRTRLCLVLWSGLCPNTPPAHQSGAGPALDTLAGFTAFVG